MTCLAPGDHEKAPDRGVVQPLVGGLLVAELSAKAGKRIDLIMQRAQRKAGVE